MSVGSRRHEAGEVVGSVRRKEADQERSETGCDSSARPRPRRARLRKFRDDVAWGRTVAGLVFSLLNSDRAVFCKYLDRAFSVVPFAGGGAWWLRSASFLLSPRQPSTFAPSRVQGFGSVANAAT